MTITHQVCVGVGVRGVMCWCGGSGGSVAGLGGVMGHHGGVTDELWMTIVMGVVLVEGEGLV